MAQFMHAIAPCGVLIHKAVSGTLRVPNFDELCSIIKEVYTEVEKNETGANATYIP